jgi:hypothetical protein
MAAEKDKNQEPEQEPEDTELPHAQPAEESLKIHGDKIEPAPKSDS